MRRYLNLALGFILAGLSAGCASNPVPSPSDPPTAVQNAIPYIRGVSAAATKLALQYVEKDPLQRSMLKARISMVAIQLRILVTAGDVDPDQVRASLKIEEPWFDEIMEGVAMAYQVCFDRIKAEQEGAEAVEVVKALADGIAAGCQ